MLTEVDKKGLIEGLTYTSERVVDGSVTAVAIGSGDMDVFATPAMVALMENAAMNAVAGHLDDGYSTVGTEVSINHIKATPMNDTVRATASLRVVEGRRLVFEVMASDSEGVIGEGTHIRFVVEREKFLKKIKK